MCSTTIHCRHVCVCVQVSEMTSFVSELRHVASVEQQACRQLVRDNVDDAGPPTSAVEQLHLLTGQLAWHPVRTRRIRLTESSFRYTVKPVSD